MAPDLADDASSPAPLRGWPKRFASFLFDSLQGRFVLAMLGGLALVQLAVNLVWYSQIEQRVRRQTELAAHHVASGAIGAVRALRELPAAYRPLLIEQLRTMGGTRFLVFFNNAEVAVAQLPGQPMARMLEQQVTQELTAQLPKDTRLRVALASPIALGVSPGGALLGDLPESWVEPSLITAERPAPFLVIQAETEPGQWLYLGSTLPDPYFLEQLEFFTWQRLTPQLLALGLAVGLTLIAVRAITRPLAGLSQAAARVGRRVAPKPLRVSGTQEVRQAIEAFNDMQERIRRYIGDRERLFASISHDLRTPITRLRLRSELLDDPAVQDEFHEDLDELDMMVKTALQIVKDTDIHENRAPLRIDLVLQKMVRDARMGGHKVELECEALTVFGKPLALKRAIGNLLDNAMFYGEGQQQPVEVGIAPGEDGMVLVTVRDHGPGVPEAALARLGQPYMRLEHGAAMRKEGLGLGLSIVREIVGDHGGTLRFRNHPEGGFEVRLALPAG
ncbi:ATP-binding protein [Roseateles saccharophilus]|uniref:histidine kinase n=1 Tax=Roseateles saccharophilus TaxID=304 RepID=A0A4R3UHT8_ROSSA|nr:ATP-binding protein [Roseateles saccharophilus]MDG0833940.1 HAMP domain-containing protein [Roseateles saccharophilus]TCU91116.1 signal transduction histidine kinase [Roseateles saccharophilus]